MQATYDWASTERKFATEVQVNGVIAVRDLESAMTRLLVTFAASVTLAVGPEAFSAIARVTALSLEVIFVAARLGLSIVHNIGSFVL